MDTHTQTVIALNLALWLQLVGLGFAAQIDSYVHRDQKRRILMIAGLLFTLILKNPLDIFVETSHAPNLLRVVSSVYGYCVRPLVIVLFMQIVKPEKPQWPCWVLLGVNAAINLTAFFSRIAFWYDADGFFHRGPLGYSCLVVSYILLVWHVAQVVGEYRKVRKYETLIPIFTSFLIIAAVVVDMYLPFHPYVSFLTVSMVSGCLYYYVWLHLQFVRDHEQALRAEQRIQIMMSQIQPHFLYNTLSTIQALCMIDPEQAFDTLGKFGTYLRQNIDSLDQPTLVPFQKELEHTQVYVEIEMIRFPSIQVTYHIQDEDFALPALTVQPLVENAIRHGVRIRDHGLVSVSTYRDALFHVIVIQDNGKGFDVEKISGAKGSHIGLRNVRDRVEQMCGGSMTIDSKIGKGTTVTIRLPFGKEQL